MVVTYSAHPNHKERFSREAADKAGAHWDFLDLVQVRSRCEDAGMRLFSIENPFPHWCWDRIKLGLPGRDQQIENLAITIRNMGRAGIPVMGYNWMVNHPRATRYAWRTSLTTPGRGGSQATSFDMELAKESPLFRDREYAEEEMWANYEYFVKAIIPVAEEAGVGLAVHPDDPPVEKLGGVARLFRNVDGFRRAMALADSPASGLILCLGNWTAMGVDILAAIRHFGTRGQIIYVHAQGVQGTVPSFRESFLDEADCDFLAVLRVLREVGFDEILLPSHFPHTLYDNDREDNGLAYATGYMKGLLAALEL